jgi:cytochrome c peroxidase
MRLLLIATLLPAGVAAQDLPVADAVFAPPNPAEVALGQLLFYDKILSGNRQVACATCHNPALGTGDGVSLGLGDGASGLGVERRVIADNMPEKRVPRNAPPLFNLGADQFTRMFYDGRLEADDSRPSGIRSPLEEDMVAGFNSVLAAQAMFPVLSGDEMAGHYSENEISQAVRLGFLSSEGGAWDRITARVTAIPAYSEAFTVLKGAEAEIRFTDIANAIAAFTAAEWRADDSPFDRYLRDGSVMEDQAMAGMGLFYGRAGCSVCHSGQFQTDNNFYAIAMPQIGPGKAAAFESYLRDTGRMRVTGRGEDAYRFRTPSLRNVTQTAPYGHAGAYGTLEAVVRHHLDPVAALRSYDPAQAVFPDLPGAQDFDLMADPVEVEAIAAANELAPVALSDDEVAEILAFLAALTDPGSITGRLGVPESVPSGLPVDQLAEIASD